MNGLEHSTTGAILLLLLLLLPVAWGARLARQGKIVPVRKIAGVGAIEEAVGRAAEQGRAVSFTTALTGLGPVLYSCLGVLRFIAEKTAMYRSKLLVPQSAPDVLAVTEQTVQQAYQDKGRANDFHAENLVYLTDAQFAFAAGYQGLVKRENVGAAFLFGEFAAESLILAESGQAIGAMQVAATTSPEQVAFFVCATDYTLIGEELFAASAFLTQKPELVASLYGQDRAKLLLLILILCGVAVATLNSLGGFSYPNVDALVRWSLW